MQVNGQFDTQTGFSVMQNVIQARPKIDLVYAENDTMALIIANLKNVVQPENISRGTGHNRERGHAGRVDRLVGPITVESFSLECLSSPRRCQKENSVSGGKSQLDLCG